MTVDQLQKEAAQVAKLNRWRYGQALFNVLFRHDPTLADKLRATKDDPFFDDSKIFDFLREVATANLLKSKKPKRGQKHR